MLCGYYGIERSDVNDLKWEQIDVQRGTIKFGKRIIKMDNLMMLCLKNIQKTQNNKKKNEYVLLKRDKNSYKRATVGVINFVFDDLEHIDESDAIWKQFSPQYVRGCLIKEMFNIGYSIEQIVYETNLNLSNISCYLSYEDILKRGKERTNSKSMAKPSHPYENIVNEFYKNIIAS